jgi:Asp-tRNA(Asn)/Glu-tRNA(Gln) amidotransferase A subunit family amidase
MAADTPWRSWGLEQTHAALSSRATDPVALTEHYLEAISRFNPRLNCFLAVDAERARQAAEGSQARWSAGKPLGLMDGIPVALKDNIGVNGWVNSAGLAARRTHVATRTAPVAQALLDAGAVLLGRLNMDEGAMSALGDNPHYGRCHNPWAIGFTPGGSSSGSGAAVAAGLAVVTLGTDTMGSVRIPAAYCGVVGLKPTFGRLSTRGVTPVNLDFDTVGPLGRRVGDVFAVLDCLGGYDQGWPAARQYGESPVVSGPLKIGRPELPDLVDATPAVTAALERVVGLLEDRGHAVESFAAPYPAQAVRRAGFLLMERRLAETFADLEVNSLSPNMASYVDYGARVSEAKVAAAQQLVADAIETWQQWLARYPLLVLPTVLHEAFRLDGEAPPDNQAGLTAPGNFTGFPALSLPAGRGADNMPVAVQFIARPGQESLLRRIAEEVEPVFGENFQLPPLFVD